ncbi:hypothetical protein [Bremerella sp.]|uniref:hypothetical protein n=1 Tax=Bremerella sp. TaxID=2795602 RepID=UPI003918A0CC
MGRELIGEYRLVMARVVFTIRDTMWLVACIAICLAWMLFALVQTDKFARIKEENDDLKMRSHLLAEYLTDQTPAVITLTKDGFGIRNDQGKTVFFSLGGTADGQTIIYDKGQRIIGDG